MIYVRLNHSLIEVGLPVGMTLISRQHRALLALTQGGIIFVSFMGRKVAQLFQNWNQNVGG